ncbi:MAG: hypothetical protein EOO50_13355 [Flavobacterium sp.]|uniref:hypothetical protein n=1 Tax=Flavobacterium sp. TaxID=239 RepID=UPI0011F811A7|nr:hypothetical protein [Flavobacterium sp.]RZJ65528.1 MAG: hypothetical protein EOO50_13355 [Flavobacterium sp.]
MKRAAFRASIFFSFAVLTLSIAVFYFSSAFVFCKPCSLRIDAYDPNFGELYDFTLIADASYVYHDDDLWILSGRVENKQNKHLFNIPFHAMIRE